MINDTAQGTGPNDEFFSAVDAATAIPPLTERSWISRTRQEIGPWLRIPEAGEQNYGGSAGFTLDDRGYFRCGCGKYAGHINSENPPLCQSCDVGSNAPPRWKPQDVVDEIRSARESGQPVDPESLAHWMLGQTKKPDFVVETREGRVYIWDENGFVGVAPRGEAETFVDTPGGSYRVPLPETVRDSGYRVVRPYTDDRGQKSRRFVVKRGEAEIELGRYSENALDHGSIMDRIVSGTLHKNP